MNKRIGPIATITMNKHVPKGQKLLYDLNPVIGHVNATRVARHLTTFTYTLSTYNTGLQHRFSHIISPFCMAHLTSSCSEPHG
jgi:hypothetical protein